MAKPKKQIDVESLTMLQLMASLKPAHLWAILVIISVLLSGAFGLGYKLKSSAAEAEVTRVRIQLESENATLKNQLESQKVTHQTEVASLRTELEEHKLEVTTLRKTEQEFRGIQTKERFFALYLRYIMSKKVYTQSPSEETEKSMDTAYKEFEKYIHELIRRGESNPREIEVTGIYIGKPPIGMGSDPNQPSSPQPKGTVKFGYDGTVWEVPPEFRIAELH